MKESRHKSSNEVIVTDASAGMDRLREATRHLMTVPKTSHGQRKRKATTRKRAS